MTMPDASAPSPGSGEELVARIGREVAVLDRELVEVDMLIGQARAEATRHEQRRAQAAEKLPAPDRRADPRAIAESYTQLVALTRRAVLMEAQVELLEGKRKALARHREAVAGLASEVTGGSVIALPPAGDAAGELPPAALSPATSRFVLNAQEDLRREIARAMHDGPAQSLTNIVLQAQIAQRFLDRDPVRAREEVDLLMAMVQQTLDATKNFIFDVRPMVLDDLGLVPTLRRGVRDRGRRAHVPVEFDSMGQDRRLPVDVESTVFRIIDEALGGYLGQTPERVVLKLDWTDELLVRITAYRSAQPSSAEPLPEMPGGDDIPDALRRMMEDRHEARREQVRAAEEAAIVVLPAAVRRDITERAASIGAQFELLADGSELRLVVPLPILETKPEEAAE